MRNNLWQKKYSALEQKLNTVNKELNDSKQEVQLVKHDCDLQLKAYASEYKSLDSNYSIAKTWAKWASATALFLGLTTGYLGIKQYNVSNNSAKEIQIVASDNKHNNSPKYEFLYHTPEGNSTAFYPFFKDDNALDMRAYAQLGSKIYEMASGSESLSDKGFAIPKEIIESDCSFKVWAIDRNNNESNKKTLYVFQRYVSEKQIPR